MQFPESSIFRRASAAPFPRNDKKHSVFLGPVDAKTEISESITQALHKDRKRNLERLRLSRRYERSLIVDIRDLKHVDFRAWRVAPIDVSAPRRPKRVATDLGDT